MSEPLLSHHLSFDNRRLSFICHHPLYVSSYERLEKLEKDRVFCRHQMSHFLDVARIAYILDLKMGLDIRQDLIYAASLLHDIGKGRQYEEGIPHETASAQIAEQILKDMPPEIIFSEHEQQEIITAIRGHREIRSNPEPLEFLLYKGDKMSRNCFACPSEPECSWNHKLKNMEIRL